ncbi:hypothetical protein JXA31_00445 [Candidatus Bathyarchaeota archaeon]|nr:hypothetical protein [Candidatus Bathyarchaeota archaeon]
MKAFPIKLMAVSISIICVLSIGFVSALESDEASVSLFWSVQTVYQGDVITVKITFTSSSTDQLTIVGYGLQFDWDPDKFYGPDISANPVTIPSYGTHIFDPITIQIPVNASIGAHSYFVGVDGAQGYSLTDFSWDSPALTIQVHSAIGRIYSDLAAQFDSKLDNASSANFESAEAKSLLQQAQFEYALSRSLTTEEKWSEALLHVQNATNILDQASAAEQRSEEQAGDLQTLLFYGAIAAIAVIIAVSIIIVIMRKRRKQPEPVEDQPVDQPLETQDFTPEE